MALIKCPECGNEVSDKAALCPRCAYPIAQPKKNTCVKIKIGMSITPAGKVKIKDYTTNKILWEGRNGEVAVLNNITAPKKIYFAWGLGNSPQKDKTFEIDPSICALYEFKVVKGILTTTFALNQIGIIDSGL